MKTINIRDDVARKVALLAARYQKSPEALVNEILEQYAVRHTMAQEESGTAFLLSIAGIFDSGPNDTSERVHTLVADAITQKHQGTLHEGTRRR